ncbi:MAG: type II toxin-antitoxin system RatA family toxin [Alphaproteobacteria bacterium]|nr:type II toxin-antitoxin system RatA family toxin [Alphaproteobacteria bacterium]
MPRHAETKLLPYSVEQMFDLVAAVERYPEFLPWCLGSRIIKREAAEVHADLLIGFKMFRERWQSRIVMARPETIDVHYVDGPFRHLDNRWRFERRPEGCAIDFYVDFEFRSRILGKVMSGLFGEAVHRMVRAFETRAHQIYGKESRASALPSGLV